MDHLASFLSAVRLLWFLKCPMVVPQSIDVSSVLISFCPVDCDAVFIAFMESNARLSCDKREIYALDYSPNSNTINRSYLVAAV